MLILFRSGGDPGAGRGQQKGFSSMPRMLYRYILYLYHYIALFTAFPDGGGYGSLHVSFRDHLGFFDFF